MEPKGIKFPVFSHFGRIMAKRQVSINPKENLIKLASEKLASKRGAPNETLLVILGGHLIRSLSADLTAFLLLGWSRSGPNGPHTFSPFFSTPGAGLTSYSTLIKRYDSNSLLSGHVALCAPHEWVEGSYKFAGKWIDLKNSIHLKRTSSLTQMFVFSNKTIQYNNIIYLSLMLQTKYNNINCSMILLYFYIF